MTEDQIKELVANWDNGNIKDVIENILDIGSIYVKLYTVARLQKEIGNDFLNYLSKYNFVD